MNYGSLRDCQWPRTVFQFEHNSQNSSLRMAADFFHSGQPPWIDLRRSSHEFPPRIPVTTAALYSCRAELYCKALYCWPALKSRSDGCRRRSVACRPLSVPRIEYGLSLSKIISKRCELVNLCYINRRGTVIWRIVEFLTLRHAALSTIKHNRLRLEAWNHLRRDHTIRNATSATVATLSC